MKRTKEEMEIAVKNATHIDQVFINLGTIPNCANYKRMKRLIKDFGLSTEHFAVKGGTKTDYSLNDISNGLRRGTKDLNRFLKYHGVAKKCNCCSLESWREKKISLDVDHINNNPFDNRLSNLQYLCPNCHRQKTAENTVLKKSFSGLLSENFCDCGKKIEYRAEKCKSCETKSRKAFKISWPNRGELYEMVWSNPLTLLSAILGVSDVGIAKHCRSNNIPYPNKKSGYWVFMKNENFEKCKEIKDSNPLL